MGSHPHALLTVASSLYRRKFGNFPPGIRCSYLSQRSRHCCRKGSRLGSWVHYSTCHPVLRVDVQNASQTEKMKAADSSPLSVVEATSLAAIMHYANDACPIDSNIVVCSNFFKFFLPDYRRQPVKPCGSMSDPSADVGIQGKGLWNGGAEAYEFMNHIQYYEN